MLPTALVPVRIEPIAKRRLAHLMDGPQRSDLVAALFRGVVRVLTDAGLPVVALAPHPIDVPDGVELWIDDAPGLNRALASAVARAGLPVLIVHADVVGLAVTDVTAMVEAPGDVVIGRARDGGTNALLLRSELGLSFGPNSALVHAQRARAAGLRTIVIDRPGLALDVDEGAALTSSSSFRRPTP